jgi:hypothetical protein
MQPPERYSVSPLPSYYTTARSPPLSEPLRALWRWLRRDRQSALGAESAAIGGAGELGAPKFPGGGWWG